MSKTIRQFRWYGDGNTKNYPRGLTSQSLINGSAFFDGNLTGSISVLGIQAAPGTKFYINGSPYAMYIGSTGNYNIDLESTTIVKLEFDSNTLPYSVNSGINGLIVDAIYGED